VKRGTKTLLIWCVLLGVVFVALFNRDRPELTSFTSPEAATRLIEAGHIRGYRTAGDLILLTMHDGNDLALPAAIAPEVWKSLQVNQVPYLADDAPSDGTSLLLWLLLIIGVVAAIIYFLRKMRGGSMQNIFELRRTKARPVEQADRARFGDIGGNRHAVELLGDIVDFLKAPQRWTDTGVRIPRGILMVGPPGTGKTLLARAVAGETKSSFFYTSATEFVEMFVGIGAARVRDTFEKAVAQQPAIIFIDELDAIGRCRGSGTGAIHEEREQTLNQLLVLMDGMERHAQLVVMAATNRSDVLDSALLRSGRFDRVLRLELPTGGERLEILNIHTRNKPLDNEVSLERIAEQTDGFSGADLEALTNQAGLLSIRRTRDQSDGNGQPSTIAGEDFDRALAEIVKSNRRFDRLDSVLVESASQFAEPTGRAVARITLVTGAVVEGEVLWMNATHIKLRLTDGSEIIVAKETAVQIAALAGTDTSPDADFSPDRWIGRALDVG
jgi:cell division protease FtsH